MSSYGSNDSDSASGFWDPPNKINENELKPKQNKEFDNFSELYQDSSSESENSVSETEHENIKKIWNNGSINKKNGRICKFKAEDKGKPFYVPRKPHFFEHDLRVLDDEEEVSEKIKYREKKLEESNCWKHDMFIEDDQKPKSKREIISTYGYDIRTDSPTAIGQNIVRERRPKHLQDYNLNCYLVHDSNLKESESESTKHRNRSDHTRLKGKDGKEKSLFKSGSHNKSLSHTTLDDDIEILNVDNLYITPVNNDYKGSTTKPQDRPIGAIAATFTRSIRRRETSPSKIEIDCDRRLLRETFVKSVGYPQVVESSCLPNLSQHPVGKSNTQTNSVAHSNYRESVFSSNYSYENKFKESKYENQTCSSKTRGSCEGRERIHGSVNVSERAASLLLGVSDNCEFADDLCSMSSAAPTFSYFNDYYNVENQESFEFPDPPDLSANHLMPCVHQQQYYLHPYYQQGLSSLTQWGFCNQPYYQGSSTSGVTFVKQEYIGSWASPHQSNQLISAPQQVDTNTYYPIPEEVKRGTKSGCSSSTKVDHKVSPVASHTSHRYSVIRAKLHLVHSTKASKSKVKSNQ